MNKKPKYHHKMVEELRKDSRISLVDLSRKLKVPISTLYDHMQRAIRKEYQFTIRPKHSGQRLQFGWDWGTEIYASEGEARCKATELEDMGIKNKHGNMTTFIVAKTTTILGSGQTLEGFGIFVEE